MRVKFTLYKKMVLLIVFVIFVSLLTAYSLILGITDTLVAQRMEIGSEKIASQITESKLVKENLMNLENFQVHISLKIIQLQIVDTYVYR